MFNKIKDYIGTTILYKLLYILIFISINASLLMIIVYPVAKGYELSIYEKYPVTLWIFIFLAFITNIAIIFIKIIKKKKNFFPNILLIILTNSLILAMPFFRNYSFYPSGDALTHIGYMKDIITLEHIGTSNFYPIVHLNGVNLRFITNLNFNLITNLFFVFWSMILLLNIYLLSSKISRNKQQSMLIVTFSSPLIFSYMHTVIHPSILSIFLIPLFLYIYHSKEQLKVRKFFYSILLIILGFTLTFSHPFSSLFTISILMGLFSSRIILFILNKFKKNEKKISIKRDINLPFIMGIIFFIWYYSFGSFVTLFSNVLVFLFNKETTTLFDHNVQAASIATNIDIFHTIRFVIIQYGSIVLYFLIASIAILYFIFKNRKMENISIYNLDYIILIFVGVFFSAFSLFNYAVEFNPIRISRFFMIFTPIILGLLLYNPIFSKMKRKQRNKNTINHRKIILVTIIFLAISFFALMNIFNIYGSAMVSRANWQETDMNFYGSSWFLENHDNIIRTSSLGLNIFRYEDFYYGVESPTEININNIEIPAHFGYDKYQNISKLFNKTESYLLTNEISRQYQYLHPESIRPYAKIFTKKDFHKLKQDNDINLIYTNSEYEAWKTNEK